MSNVPPPPPPPGFASPATQGGGAQNGVGTASLVLGIISIVTGLFVIGALFGLIGLILGIVGRKKANRGEASNGGAALAGIITSSLGILIAIGVLIVTALFLSTSDFGSFFECISDADGDQAKLDQCEADFDDNLDR